MERWKPSLVTLPLWPTETFELATLRRRLDKEHEETIRHLQALITSSSLSSSSLSSLWSSLWSLKRLEHSLVTSIATHAVTTGGNRRRPPRRACLQARPPIKLADANSAPDNHEAEAVSTDHPEEKSPKVVSMATSDAQRRERSEALRFWQSLRSHKIDLDHTDNALKKAVDKLNLARKLDMWVSRKSDHFIVCGKTSSIGGHRCRSSKDVEITFDKTLFNDIQSQHRVRLRLLQSARQEKSIEVTQKLRHSKTLGDSRVTQSTCSSRGKQRQSASSNTHTNRIDYDTNHIDNVIKRAVPQWRQFSRPSSAPTYT